MHIRLILYLLILMETACSVSNNVRRLFPEASAERYKLRQKIVRGDNYPQRIFYTPHKSASNSCLRIYLEGDGMPWIEKKWIAADPTPRNPLMLRLLLHDSGNAIYVGRPCYWGLSDKPPCTPKDWTLGRFSERIVHNTSSVIRKLIQQHNADQIALIGHSGGGVLATLAAYRVPKVTTLLTIAAPLDTAAWSKQHKYTPLLDSLNPATLPPLRKSIRQYHLVGKKDTNVPPFTQQAYLANSPDARQIIIDGLRHDLSDRKETTWSSIINELLEKAGCLI